MPANRMRTSSTRRRSPPDSTPRGRSSRSSARPSPRPAGGSRPRPGSRRRRPNCSSAREKRLRLRSEGSSSIASRSFSSADGGLVEAPAREHVGERRQVVGHAVEAGVLRQVAEAAGVVHDPVGRRAGAAQHLEQRGLAGAVAPDQPDLVAGADRERHAVEQDRPTCLDAEVPGLEHRSRVARRRANPSRNSVPPVTEPLVPLPPQPDGVPWPTAEWEEAKPDVADPASARGPGRSAVRRPGTRGARPHPRPRRRPPGPPGGRALRPPLRERVRGAGRHHRATRSPPPRRTSRGRWPRASCTLLVGVLARRRARRRSPTATGAGVDGPRRSPRRHHVGPPAADAIGPAVGRGVLRLRRRRRARRGDHALRRRAGRHGRLRRRVPPRRRAGRARVVQLLERHVEHRRRGRGLDRRRRRGRHASVAAASGSSVRSA